MIRTGQYLTDSETSKNRVRADILKPADTFADEVDRE